jgi:uncharacterized protein YheU (UPF0270 family)
MHNETKPNPESGVEVPVNEVSPETLEQMIESYILREGTDYGEREASFDRKIQDIKRQLEKKEIKIVFDLNSETCSFVRNEKLVSKRSGQTTTEG